MYISLTNMLIIVIALFFTAIVLHIWDNKSK